MADIYIYEVVYTGYRPTYRSIYIIYYIIYYGEFAIDKPLPNKYFELKNSWGANGAPQTRTTC